MNDDEMTYCALWAYESTTRIRECGKLKMTHRSR